MNHRFRILAAAATATLALTGASLAPTAQATTHHHAKAAPVIKATMSKTSLTLSDDSVRAGRITFQATTHKGDHLLQILRLHTGYTLQQALADVDAGLNHGDTAAIARLDANISWLGGAEATKKTDGYFEVTLKAGSYLAIDQEGQGATTLTVTGTPQQRSGQPTGGIITMFSYGFRSDGLLAGDSWVKVTNRADQPHFVVLQQVKKGTTRQQVIKFFKKGGNGQPGWALKAGSGIGVVSPGTTISWKLDLPRGHYTMFCFWPDVNTGMPHVAMGMVDMVNLS